MKEMNCGNGVHRDLFHARHTKCFDLSGPHQVDVQVGAGEEKLARREDVEITISKNEG